MYTFVRQNETVKEVKEQKEHTRERWEDKRSTLMREKAREMEVEIKRK